MVRFTSLFVLATVLVSGFAAPTVASGGGAILSTIRDVSTDLWKLKASMEKFPSADGVGIDKVIYRELQDLKVLLKEAAGFAKAAGHLSDAECVPIIDTIVSFQPAIYTSLALVIQKKDQFDALPVRDIRGRVHTDLKEVYHRLNAWEVAFRNIVPEDHVKHLEAIDYALGVLFQKAIEAYA